MKSSIFSLCCFVALAGFESVVDCAAADTNLDLATKSILGEVVLPAGTRISLTPAEKDKLDEVVAFKRETGYGPQGCHGGVPTVAGGDSRLRDPSLYFASLDDQSCCKHPPAGYAHYYDTCERECGNPVCVAFCIDPMPPVYFGVCVPGQTRCACQVPVFCSISVPCGANNCTNSGACAYLSVDPPYEFEVGECEN